MKLASKILIVLALAAAPLWALHAQSSKETLSPAQKAAVEDVVRELLLQKEPELIVKAAQEVQTRVEKEQSVKSSETISENRAKLFNDKTSFVMGNPKGDITIVEFFDYQCGYCKVAQPRVLELLEKDKNVRLILKELPILGPVSQTAAAAALAAGNQGKYLPFHNALMGKKDRLSEENIFALAEEMGLDADKLKADMKDAKIEKILKDNLALASAIGASGTPAFVIGERLYPGALQTEQMEEIIKTLRKAKK